MQDSTITYECLQFKKPSCKADQTQPFVHLTQT